MVMLVSEIKDYEELLDNPDWVAELKRDGNRVEVHYNREEESVKFYNRNGEAYTKQVPGEILDDLLERLEIDDYIKSFIIDGEITFTDVKGRDHRTQAQCPEAEPILWIWDIQELNGEDIRDLTWLERKTELKTICDIYMFFYDDMSLIRWVPYYIQKRKLLELAEENNMEGIVLKYTQGKYINGKTKEQVKVKFAQTDDFIVVGYVNAVGTKTGKREKYFGSLILAQYGGDGILKPKGRVGGGFEDSDLEEITPMLHRDLNDDSDTYYKDNVSNNKDNYVDFTDKDYGLSKNKINWLDCNDWFVIEVKYHGLTEYKKPFQPRFISLRKDKDIEECVEND